ncbi:MAG: SUMF1/EgtB/PvdO family nonheme iron enzyme, partial [Nitrospirota bacterium]
MNTLSEKDRKHLEKMLDILKDKWQILEEKRAMFGTPDFPSSMQYELNDTESEIRGISIKLGIPPPFERLKPEIQSVEPDSTPINRQKLEDVFRTEYRLDKLDFGHLGATREQLNQKLELQSVYVALKVKERTFDRLMTSANITALTSHQQKNLPRLFQQIDELVRLEQEKNQRSFETNQKEACLVMDERLSHFIACKILMEANAENIRAAKVIINEIKSSHPNKHQQVMSILQALSNLAVISRSLAEIPGKARFHLLIGDAGAGKSTACRYMALRCFEGLQAEFEITGTTPLPIYLRLEDFGKMVADYTDGLHCLLACAANFWQGSNKSELFNAGQFHPPTPRQRGIEGSNKSELFNAGQLLYAISHQPVWLFLDGLDEISNPDNRLKLADIVCKIAQSNLFPQLRITLTSRPATITNELLDKLGIPDFHILDLEQSQIVDFAHKYFAANLPEETERKKQAQEFLSALNAVPAAGRLASNPLLLTVIAVLHYKAGALPRYRVELYEKCIDQLMAQKATTPGRLGTGNITFKYPLASIDWDHFRIIDVLCDLAFHTHQNPEDEMLLKPEFLRKRLQESKLNLIPEEIKSSAVLEQVAKEFLDECDRLIGLLAFRGGHYVFVHRTFQEYLAVKWLGLQREAVQEKYLLTMLQNPAHWQEVIRLFFNWLGKSSPEFGKELVDKVHQMALSQENKSLILLLAQCLTDFEEYRQDEPLHNEIKASLQQFRNKSHRQPQLFLASGNALGLLDEPHIDVADPPMVCFKPDKPFNMGSNKYDEQPIHSVKLSPYWLGKYPVTNKEFGEFIKGGGYETKEYWFDEESRFKFDGREFLKGLKEKVPSYWLDERFGKGRQLAPVVGISWYEAMAYCRWWTLTFGVRWLATALESEDRELILPSHSENIPPPNPRQRGINHPLTFAGGGHPLPALDSGGHRRVIMRLPTEAEWEFAARGFEGREYPWGNTPEPSPEQANYNDSHLEQTSTVGSYPLGAT